MKQRVYFFWLTLLNINFGCQSLSQQKAARGMNLRLERNATMRWNYGGVNLLTDPMLGKKESLPSFAEKTSLLKNPTVSLRTSTEEILDGVELVVISHLHPDHFDLKAAELLQKSMPLLVISGANPQVGGFVKHLKGMGFTRVTQISSGMQWGPLTITPVFGQHGTGHIKEQMGDVAGLVFQAAEAPTVYWTGDTIWEDTENYVSILEKFKPDVVVTHSCGANPRAFFPNSTVPIIMDDVQTVNLAKAAIKVNPLVKVIAVHMEALDHCTVSRQTLRESARLAGLDAQQLMVPEDGETLELE